MREFYDPLCFLSVSQRGLNVSGFTVRWNITRRNEWMLVGFYKCTIYFLMMFYFVSYEKASNIVCVFSS